MEVSFYKEIKLGGRHTENIENIAHFLELPVLLFVVESCMEVSYKKKFSSGVKWGLTTGNFISGSSRDEIATLGMISFPELKFLNVIEN